MAIFSPFATAHNRIDTFSVPRHQEPEARYRPHGEKASANGRLHPSGSRIAMWISCVMASHNRISPITPPAIQRPQGENVITSMRRGRSCFSACDSGFTARRISGTATLNSAAANDGWIGNLPTSFPFSTFHRRTVLSHDALASRLPSGENAADWMRSVCARRMCSFCPLCTSQTISIPFL